MLKKNNKISVALITGSARRVGASIAKALHEADFNVVIHYKNSEKSALKLKTQLNKLRPHSAEILQADLDQQSCYELLIKNTYKIWGRLDALVNNASTFKSTSIGKTDLKTWDLLLNSNLKAPYFLSQAASNYLKKSRGNIINITDIHAKTPMKNYTVYCIAKAGLSMLTKSLALELAPHIRVNAVAPGSVIWPEGENTYSKAHKQKILSATLLKKQVKPDNIAQAVLFLIHNSAITGKTITVDGGKI